MIRVLPWPASRPLIAAAPEAGLDLLVISVATADNTIRHAGRAQLRDAVREVLGLRLNRAPETIELISIPGQAIRVDLTGHRFGMSASHEPGISVAAIHRWGPVGIDIMRQPREFEWQSVARDYLGPQTLDRIASMPQSEQLNAFACEWTRLEACLKCIGVGLQEWDWSLHRQIQACHVIKLDLPAGLLGAVACRKMDRPTHPDDNRSRRELSLYER